MTGEELLTTLKVGECLRLKEGSHKVHRAFLDGQTGAMRICRPSMLDKANAAGQREWIQVPAIEYYAHPCAVCQ